MNRNESVLVIEDEENIQAALKEALTLFGYEVAPATCASDALEILRSGKNFSLILLDLSLPDMNGLDLLEKLHTEASKRVDGSSFELPPILLLSANSELHQMQLPAGIVGRIGKPFELAELIQAVQKFSRKNAA